MKIFSLFRTIPPALRALSLYTREALIFIRCFAPCPELFGKLHKVLDIAADKPAVLIRRKIYNRKVLRVRHCPFSAATSLSCSARTLLFVRFAVLHWRSASFFIRRRCFLQKTESSALSLMTRTLLFSFAKTSHSISSLPLEVLLSCS